MESSSTVSVPDIEDVCYLTLGELRDWVLQLARRSRKGDDALELAQAAVVALQHPEAKNLGPNLIGQLERLKRAAIPVVQGRSGLAKEPRTVTGGVREKVTKALIPPPQKPEYEHVPGYPRGNRVWDFTGRDPIDRVARRGMGGK